MTQIDGYRSKDGRRVDMYGMHLPTAELFAAHATITVGSNPGEMSLLLFDDQELGIAAIWLFGTAQIGLAGISEQRQTV